MSRSQIQGATRQAGKVGVVFDENTKLRKEEEKSKLFTSVRS